MRRRSAFAGALALAALITGSCGGSSDPVSLNDQGYEALGRSDSKAAYDSFQEALGLLEPADPQYLRARLGAVEALVRLDAVKAKDEFLALARAEPQRVTAKDYLKVAHGLVSENQLDPAIDLLEAVKKGFPGDPRVDETAGMILERARKLNRPEAIQRMNSLGY